MLGKLRKGFLNFLGEVWDWFKSLTINTEEYHDDIDVWWRALSDYQRKQAHDLYINRDWIKSKEAQKTLDTISEEEEGGLINND